MDRGLRFQRGDGHGKCLGRIGDRNADPLRPMIDPDLAIFVGKQLCENVLEPIQAALGRLSIRSAYRSCAVNAKGAENKNQYNCSKNEANYAGHIWDKKDAE